MPSAQRFENFWIVIGERDPRPVTHACIRELGGDPGHHTANPCYGDVIPKCEPNRLLGVKGFAKIEAIADGEEAVYTSDEAKRRFEILARQVFSRFEAQGVTSPEVGAAYRREILEPNGAQDAAAYPAAALLSTGQSIVGETIRYPTSGAAHVTASIIVLAPGAKTIVHLASSSDVAGITGKYYYKCYATTPSPHALDDHAALLLWERSAVLAGMNA